VAAVALGAATVVVVAPATADMAAHVFRAGLWEREGFTRWNPDWYGGHPVPGYSVLFPPLGGWLGPRIAGGLGAVVATWLFTRVCEQPAARWLFAAGVTSSLVVGRMPFVAGVALGVAAWWAADRGRRGSAGGLGAATTLASPVAGVFLVALATVRPRGALAVAVPAAAAGAALAILFPTGGTERFVATAFWPALALTVAAAALVGGRLRIAGALCAAMLVAAFALPTPMGHNAMRLPLLLGPVALALAAPRTRVTLLVGAGLLYLQWLPAVRAVTEAHGDPSTQAAFHAEVREVVAGERTEVVFTRNHWEAAHLAPHAPLARGWERQRDRHVNPLFYDGGLDAAAYRAWLRAKAVRFVALPAVSLDYSALEEAALLRSGVPGLREVHRTTRWRVWEVTG
jgi:hypothetical protein